MHRFVFSDSQAAQKVFTTSVRRFKVSKTKVSTFTPSIDVVVGLNTWLDCNERQLIWNEQPIIVLNLMI